MKNIINMLDYFKLFNLDRIIPLRVRNKIINNLKFAISAFIHKISEKVRIKFISLKIFL